MSALSGVDPRVFDYYPHLRNVKLHVDRHYCEPISLAVAAEVAGLERTYFSKYFRSKTGVNFRDWLRGVRVERALEMLTHDDCTITDVAFAVGFQDLRTFERAMERCTGASPLAAKRRLRPLIVHGE